MKRCLARLLCLALCILSVGAPSAGAWGAPALAGGVIRDLESIEQALEQGKLARVVSHGKRQAERFGSGNAADRYASALYRQLAASALTEQERYAKAAAQLARARQALGPASALSRRWLREQARLYRAAGEQERAIARLSEWLETASGGAERRDERWRLIGWLAREQRWQEAAEQLDSVTAEGAPADDHRRRLALVVNLNAGRMEKALGELAAGLDGESPATDWRRAAGVAQRAGQPGVAAGLWDTGWRLGRLERPDDYWQLLALHMAGGTPARAAELLETGLAEGRVVRSGLTLEQRAAAWQQAGDIPRALAAREALARHTQSAHQWRTLGQLAYAWGKGDRAKAALERAVALGDEQARQWLATL
ncbi:hypothetical protein P1P91_07385 [Halomonas piscis]|uniref:Tetratricopeptide repeat protein n=1 Tax=Halomonas piscis TaxID=3031727 RepID=A0ABY9Z2W9_9GAMM|nr:hypothetical protein [Halomonas piscis]WNK21483.1 hypothetical protein P1P91_07385 [Halomonas piscis]